MGKSCETCTRWAEHYYWDILDDQGKCFFKVIMDNLHEMAIPEKFAGCFNGKIYRTIKLEARNGSICEIAVKRSADKIILKAGWEKFVKEHDLRMGDFLVFRYNGDSRFKVEIFDPSGCEKASSSVNMTKHRSTQTVESSNEHHSRPFLDNTTGRSSSSIPSEEPDDDFSAQNDVSANNAPPYMIGSNAHLTPAQEDKVAKIVQAIYSHIPILVTIMSKSHVSRRKRSFEFLRKYAATYLPQEKQRVVLQRHGKRWEMWLNAPNSDHRRRLVHGWSQFVQGNDLQIGDVCLFHLLNNKTMCTINVHVIRAMKHGRQ